MHPTVRASVLALAASLPLALQAATPHDTMRLYQRALAATCANCHGTDGRTTPGSTIPALAGMPRDYMVAQLQAFRDGSRPATVMQQLVQGFSDEQIQSVATYFSSLTR